MDSETWLINRVIISSPTITNPLSTNKTPITALQVPISSFSDQPSNQQQGYEMGEPVFLSNNN
jgi:hypothetical protein